MERSGTVILNFARMFRNGLTMVTQNRNRLTMVTQTVEIILGVCPNELDAPGTVGRGQISSTPNASSTHEGRELISLGLSCWVYTTLSSNQKAEQSTRQRTAAPELSLRGGERPLHQPAVLYTILPPGRPYGWPCLSACVKRGTNHPPR